RPARSGWRSSSARPANSAEPWAGRTSLRCAAPSLPSPRLSTATGGVSCAGREARCMPTTLPHLIPVPRHAGHAPPPGAPCTAWSVHAADLAADVAGLVHEWGWTPTAQALEAEGQLVQLLPGIFAPPDLLDSPIDRVISLGCAIGSRLRPHHVVAGA